ncbi:hypothetical protein SprV_0902670300 [Sparganum proliferum]
MGSSENPKRQANKALVPAIASSSSSSDQLVPGTRIFACISKNGVYSLSYLCSVMRPSSEGEVADVIRKFRNNKAAGEDGIPAEIFKSCIDTLAPWLHEMIERAWKDEVVPDDWGLGILVPILKNGDKTRCENYRGISLIDVAAKIFTIVLLRRFRAVRDSRTRPNQAGFRAGRGCADQIFTLRPILEFRHSCQQRTAVCFIDFAAAFDSVHYFKRNYTHRMGVSSRMRIYEDGTHRNIDAPNTSSMPNSAPTSKTNNSPSTTAAATTTTTTTTVKRLNNPTDSKFPNLSCSHYHQASASHISLVGRLRIHRTDTGESVPGPPAHSPRPLNRP